MTTSQAAQTFAEAIKDAEVCWAISTNSTHSRRLRSWRCSNVQAWGWL